MTSEGDFLWSFTSLFTNGVALEFGPPAIGDDGTVYVSSGQAVYAVNIALTPVPSSMPTSFPSVVCPGGVVVTSSQGQECEECDEGEYSDGVQCYTCASGRTNVGQGNSHCDLFVSTVEPIIVYVASGVFLFCVLVSFVLSVLHGSPVLSIAGVLLVVGDQISDMLFASQATFYSYSLLLAGGFFCVIPLLPFVYLVLVRSSPLEWSCVRSTCRMHKKISCWHNDSGGWLFHKLSIHSLVWKFFPYLVIMVVGDITWPFLRIAFMCLYFAGLSALQTVFLVLGVLIHATKLITHRDTNDMFWWLWSEENTVDEDEMEKECDQTNDLEKRLMESHATHRDCDELHSLTNSIIVLETVFENIPQLFIQCINNKLAYGLKVWPTLAIVSITFSSLMVATVLYHFGYYMYFCEKRPFVEVPKFDLFITTLRPDDDDDDDDHDKEEVQDKSEDVSGAVDEPTVQMMGMISLQIS